MEGWPPLHFGEHQKRIILALTIAAGTLGGCAVYVPAEPGVVVVRQGGPGNGFCPPGRAKKGNC
jgi:hypothetical protein